MRVVRDAYARIACSYWNGTDAEYSFVINTKVLYVNTLEQSVKSELMAKNKSLKTCRCENAIVSLHSKSNNNGFKGNDGTLADSRLTTPINNSLVGNAKRQLYNRRRA